MTDKVDKFLSTLSAKELGFIESLFSKLREENYIGLNIKKLEGQTDIFRIKKGLFRIIVQMNNSKITLISIGRRSEKTYKDF